MFNVDFAYFNMLETERGGLAKSRYFLNRLAAFMYFPRIEKFIDLGINDLQGCNLLLPLGKKDWYQLEEYRQVKILQKIDNLIDECSLKSLALNRNGKDFILSHRNDLIFTFGDIFIKLLVAVFIEDTLSRRDIKHIILMGEIPGLKNLLEYISKWGVPISIQNYQPHKFERITHDLLYHKGIAITNSQIKPQSWQKGDLVLGFDITGRRFALMSPDAFYLPLDNESRGLAPYFEARLMSAGLDSSLATLAPIMENCLLKNDTDFEIDEENNVKNYYYNVLIDRGWQMGLWLAFLDKQSGGLYNTIKEN